MPNLNDNFVYNIFGGEVFPTHEDLHNSVGEWLDWDRVHSQINLWPGQNRLIPNDLYSLRLDTFYTFDPSYTGNHTYISNMPLSGRVYNESTYIASIDGKPSCVSIEEGLGRSDIKEFPFSIEDDLPNATGIEFTCRSFENSSNILDMRLVAEWYHWTVPIGGTEKDAFWQVATKNITKNFYQSKPIIEFPEDTIRPMEIYSKAHIVSGSEDESYVQKVYSGWDKVAGVWFDENANIQYSGKDNITRTPSKKQISYSIYEIPDSGYEHYENELYTQYKIVYSGETANKYKDTREVSFTKKNREVAEVERRITRASSNGEEFADDWEVLSKNASSPFLDTEELADYVSERLPIKEEDVYEVVSYTGNVSPEDYTEIDIIPDTGWGGNPGFSFFPHCLKEDELFFNDGCNIRARQEGGYDRLAKSNFSEVKIYFQDTNPTPHSGYKIEFQSTPPDESKILQLQEIDEVTDGSEVYLVGQAVGEKGSAGEAVFNDELLYVPAPDEERIVGLNTTSSDASSRKLDSAVNFGMTESVNRGEVITPRTVPVEEYSDYLSGQKYVVSPYGAYSEHSSAKSFASAGVLYSNFGDISLQNDYRSDISVTTNTYSLYEQKQNKENNVYFKDEKETRIFESGLCSGNALIDFELPGVLEFPVFSPWDEKYPTWSINIEIENGTELGTAGRTGIISCEPDEGEENYFFSSQGVESNKEKFLGNERLNYFLSRNYITGVYGNVLQMAVYPDENPNLDLPKGLFDGGDIYYVERDVYVDSNLDSQANYIEPNTFEQNKQSSNINNDILYLTQTFHTLNDANSFDEGGIHESSPLHEDNRQRFFNLQLKTKELLEDTNDKSCVHTADPVNAEGNLVILSRESIAAGFGDFTSKNGIMVQKSEVFTADGELSGSAEKYFPNSAGVTASETTIEFTGLTVGKYYELQKKNSSSWPNDNAGKNPSTDFPNNKPNAASKISLDIEQKDVGETYRLREWSKEFSHGEITIREETKLGTIKEGTLYRLVKLNYKFEKVNPITPHGSTSNWIINKNFFENSDRIHKDALGEQKTTANVVGYRQLLDWLYTNENLHTTKGRENWRYKRFLMGAAYSRPGNPHITRNMEGSPFKSLKDFDRLNEFEYEFNGLRLPYYLEAKNNGRKEKGGAQISKGDGSYSYGDFFRLRVTKYIYRIYKKNAFLLGDLAKSNGQQDFGGWNFNLEKSIKSNGTWGNWQEANVLSEGKITPNYYPADQLGLPYYPKGFNVINGNFDQGSSIDVVMLETDETAKYQPKDIRFRVIKKQIIETNNECKVQSKYNFLPVNISWTYLEGAKDITDDLDPWSSELQYQEVTLEDMDIYSYAIVKDANEEVGIVGSAEELKIFRLKEEFVAADQYTTKSMCETAGGEWNNEACNIKVTRRGRGTSLTVDEPVLIENIPKDLDGLAKLRITTTLNGGSVETQILRLPLSYKIEQKALVNGTPKVTHEKEVQGHNVNSVRVGESGDEIHGLTSDFECMNDGGSLVTYVVTPITGVIDNNASAITATTTQENDFYNSPFQTSDFTVSGDNNIGGVFVCSGQSEIIVKADTEQAFHIVNAPGAQNVKVKNIEGSVISTLVAGEGAQFEFDVGAWSITNKDVTKLTRASSQNNAVLSDYSKIIGQDDFKLIEDENIYLEPSDNDEQIVFDCLSKINLPSSPSTFSFTGINITTESIPIVSPDNHLINGELIHYVGPKSEFKVSYATNAFNVEIISELETETSKLNIDRSRTQSGQTDKFRVKTTSDKGIYVTEIKTLTVTLPALGAVSEGFQHAFVIKSEYPNGNTINFKGALIRNAINVHGVIIERKGDGWILREVSNPRPKLGTDDTQPNVVIAIDEVINWDTPSNVTVNFLKIDKYTPERMEYDVSNFLAFGGAHFYIKNETREGKIINLFDGRGTRTFSNLLSFTDDSGDPYSDLPVEDEGLMRVDFIGGLCSSMGFNRAVQVANNVIVKEESGTEPLPQFQLMGGQKPSGLDDGYYYFSVNEIKGDSGYFRYVIPVSAVGGAAGETTKGKVPVIKLVAGDFKVMTLPPSPYHSDMGDLGTNDYTLPSKEPYVKNEKYIIDYSDVTKDYDHKLYIIPLFRAINQENKHTPSVALQGLPEGESFEAAPDTVMNYPVGDPYLSSDEIATSRAVSFLRNTEGVILDTLKDSAETDEEGLEGANEVIEVTEDEKIVRIVSEDVGTINLDKANKTTGAEILIINELSTNVTLLPSISTTTDRTIPGRSAVKATYGGSSYSITDVQFYEVVYYSNRESENDYEDYPNLKTNKFYDKSDYDDEVLLFNTSVKIEGSLSTATKWIDRNKYRCNINKENVGEITYAYNNTNLNEDKYYILDTPLYINEPSSGFVINKSNNVVNMGEGVLYSDEVWHESVAVDGYLYSPNLKNENYFIKLNHHTITPRAWLGRSGSAVLEAQQKEIINFCRINKLSPRAYLWFNKDNVLVNAQNELGEESSDVDPYKYGITLYGNKLNSSKKVNFEFGYHDLYERFTRDLKFYDDLIYGKKIPSRALSNAIGFSPNTGHETIIKCILFNERTHEATFSGIESGKKYLVATGDYTPSTNDWDSITDLDSKKETSPTVTYNGIAYPNVGGNSFVGIKGITTYSISSLDFANVKVSLLSDLMEKDAKGEEIDPVVHSEKTVDKSICENAGGTWDETYQTCKDDESGDPVLIPDEPTWKAMPTDNKTITISFEGSDPPVVISYEDGASYIVGSIWNNVSNGIGTAAVGEVYSFSNGVNFTVGMIDDLGTTFYGRLVGGNIYSGDTGTYNPSKEIKESKKWGTVIKGSSSSPDSYEMLSGYRWSNFLVRHTRNYEEVRSLIGEGENINNKYYFITIKKQPEETYSPVIDDEWTTLIKTVESDDSLYILRRATGDDPPFNKYSKIEGVTLSEPTLPSDIARIKIGENDVFIPDNNYTIITTDNQAFKEDLSISESKTAEALSRQATPVVGNVDGTSLLLKPTPKTEVVSAEDVLESRNQYYEDVALNPTKNYANEVGFPGGISFYVGEGIRVVEKIRIRLSRLVGRRIILQDYTNHERVKSLTESGIDHQLKYILEGEVKSAYAYDEKVCRGLIKIGSTEIGLSTSAPSPGIDATNSTITYNAFKEGDAIVFESVTPTSDSGLFVGKVYFVKPIDVQESQDEFNLFRAKKLEDEFRETFTGLTDCTFRIVSRTDGMPKIALESAESTRDIGKMYVDPMEEGSEPVVVYQDPDSVDTEPGNWCGLYGYSFVVVNKTCFKKEYTGDSYLKLGLETYSFEYREGTDYETGGVRSVDHGLITNIFNSRNNFVRNFYVLKYYKNDKKTVILHLTKGRTYRYFIKSNVDKIVYGPDTDNDKLEFPASGIKGTFEAKQEQVEIVFDEDVLIEEEEPVVEEVTVQDNGGQGITKTGGIGTVSPEYDWEYSSGGLGWSKQAGKYAEVMVDGTYRNVKLSYESDLYPDGEGPLDNNDVALVQVTAEAKVVIENGIIVSVDIEPGKAGSGYIISEDYYIYIRASENPTLYPPDIDPANDSNDLEAWMFVSSLYQEPVINTKHIFHRICILEELKYEETDKDLVFKPHSDGSGYEVQDKGYHGIFKSVSRLKGGGHSGMDDVLLDWETDDNGKRIFDEILPEEISTINPHIKKIKGGASVELSWTMGDKYWEGFWFNTKKYMPKSYTYKLYRTKRGAETEDKELEESIAENYLYTKVLVGSVNEEMASLTLQAAEVETVDAIVNGAEHTVGTHQNVKLIGGSTWTASSPRAIATIVVNSEKEIASVTITEGGEGYGIGEKLTIPGTKASALPSSSWIGGTDATCVVATVNALEGSKYKTILIRGGVDHLTNREIFYDKGSSRYSTGINKNGFLRYIPGANEKYLVYNGKKYSSVIDFTYSKDKILELIGKEIISQRQIFKTGKGDYEEGDTFYGKIFKETLHVVGDSYSEEEREISRPMRIPSNWVSSFSASDIQNSQRFKDVKQDMEKVRLEIIADSSNKGIELPESLLRVIVPKNNDGNPVRMKTVDGCYDTIRNIFFRLSFTSAKVCIYDPIIEGRISNVKLLNKGKNYFAEPTVTFDNPPVGYTIDDGTGKMILFNMASEGRAKLDTEGKISNIIITNPGAGYGWKEGRYEYEKTDVKPIVHNLLKIKTNPTNDEKDNGYIIGASNDFKGEKFFTYGYQLANGTERRIDPVSVTIEENPEDALSNVLSMGITSDESDAINKEEFGKTMLGEEDEPYYLSEMSRETQQGGSARTPETEIPQGAHQDQLDDLINDITHDFAHVTPDEEGGQGREDDSNATLENLPQGTEIDPTSSSITAKALGIVNDVSLADYRVIKRPTSKTSYPWIAGMGSSTRPDYPMSFGIAPHSEISADAFNNMVDAANSLSKVSIDLPVYVRIKKHVEETYRHVPNWGLSSTVANDIENYYGSLEPKDSNYLKERIDLKENILEDNDIWCGPSYFDGNYSRASTDDWHGVASKDLGVDIPFDDIYESSEIGTANISQRKIETSIRQGKIVASFNLPPETYVKEINSISDYDISSKVEHRLVYGCYAKGYNVHQLFIQTTLEWCEYEILHYGSYAEAALGDLSSNLDKNSSVYEGVLSTSIEWCNWEPLPRPRGGTGPGWIPLCGNHSRILSPLYADNFVPNEDMGIKDIYGPNTTYWPDYGEESNVSIVVSNKGRIKIDPLSEAGGTIYGLYGALKRSVSGYGDFTVSCIKDCTPSIVKRITFPRGKSNGFMLNLDKDKINGADCF